MRQYTEETGYHTYLKWNRIQYTNELGQNNIQDFTYPYIKFATEGEGYKMFSINGALVMVTFKRTSLYH